MLVAIAGPLKGQSFETGTDLVIGRDAGANVHIGDISVSRLHCRIADGKILDLDSLNGTFVNGFPVKERELHQDDRIDVGNSQFLYVLSDAKALLEVLELDDADVPPSTIHFVKENSVTSRLLEFSAELHRIRTGKKLQQRLMELLFDSIPAERGAIVFADRSADNYSSVFTWSRSGGAQTKLRISKTVASLVLREGEAILCSDSTREEKFRDAKSLMESGARSLLCAPLYSSGDKIQGFIYLDSAGKSTFTAAHLELAAALSGIASVAFENIAHLEWLAEDSKRLHCGTDGHGMIGESLRMQEVFRFISKAAPADSTVLILGESGTGKELVARALHEKSARSSKPFVAINCAALTEPLLESELFGHERGAFTGAIAQKKGKLEVADGGTVFLDEVAELSPALQAKLLRVLQERQFERVGGTRPIHVDLRLLAATNRDLKEAIKDNSFRQDLYYRLNVLSVTMPPLRDRRTDIPLLAVYFAVRSAGRVKRHIAGVSPDAREFLTGYEWPGNVRELENAIEHAVVLGNTEQILPEDLPESILESKPAANLSGYHEGIRETKKQLILKAVESSGGTLTGAAKILGVHPNYLHRLIRNLGLRELLKKLQ